MCCFSCSSAHVCLILRPSAASSLSLSPDACLISCRSPLSSYASTRAREHSSGVTLLACRYGVSLSLSLNGANTSARTLLGGHEIASLVSHRRHLVTLRLLSPPLLTCVALLPRFPRSCCRYITRLSLALDPLSLALSTLFLSHFHEREREREHRSQICSPAAHSTAANVSALVQRLSVVQRFCSSRLRLIYGNSSSLTHTHTHAER